MPLPVGCTSAAPKPGVDTVVAITGTSLAGLIETIFGRKGIPLAAALGYVSYQTGTFCAAGPPSLPTIDAVDWADWTLLSLGLSPTRADSLQRLQDTIGHFAWYDFCQCTNTPATPPDRLTPPAGAPDVNTTHGPPPTAPCIDVALGVDFREAAYVDPIPGDPRRVINITEQVFGSGQLSTNTDTILSGTPSVTTAVLPTPLPVSIEGLVDHPVPTSPNVLYNMYVRTWTSDGAIRTSYGAIGAANSDGTILSEGPYVFAAADAHVAVLLEESGVAPPAGCEAHVRLNCQPGSSLPAECCPPDQYSTTLLLRIVNLIENLRFTAASSPTSWRDGVRHTSLRASGRLVLSAGVVGVRCDNISVPPSIPVHPGNPNFYFNLGFITPIAIDVPLRGQRLVFSPQSFALPQFADGIAWTLESGATMDLVELLPVTP